VDVEDEGARSSGQEVGQAGEGRLCPLRLANLVIGGKVDEPRQRVMVVERARQGEDVGRPGVVWKGGMFVGVGAMER
jgi:hypothetical protein